VTGAGSGAFNAVSNNGFADRGMPELPDHSHNGYGFTNVVRRFDRPEFYLEGRSLVFLQANFAGSLWFIAGDLHNSCDPFHRNLE
jgi:hypothetical protein